MKRVVISQPMLFPWPGFFEQMALADVYIWLDDAQFSKGSFTNRVQMRHGDASKWLTIPLAGKGSFQRIDELSAAGVDWKASHRAFVAQALADAPFASEALAVLDAAYTQERLVDLLIASAEAPAKALGAGVGRQVLRSSDMGVEGQSWRRVLDLVRAVGGDCYITGHGAARYMDHDAFEAAGVAVDYMDYSLTPWPCGARSFTPYVSVLELIAWCGAEAGRYLAPRVTPWRDFMKARAAQP